MLASRSGDVVAVRVLVAAKADTNKHTQVSNCAPAPPLSIPHITNISNSPEQEGYTALMYAAQCGHADVIQLLLGAGVNVDAQNTVRYFHFAVSASLT
jgi:ankyrin repeat protein